MYQVYKIICQTDKLGGCSEADFEDPTTKAAIKAKLDQLAINEMTKTLSKVDASKKVKLF